MTEAQIDDLKRAIERLADAGDDVGDKSSSGSAAAATIGQFLDTLERGDVRAATQNQDGVWVAHSWVKAGILAAFRIGGLAHSGSEPFSFVDREILPPRYFGPADRVRVVPGGTTVRRGAHLGVGTVCMPPSFVNIGAFVDADSMVDSHVLVGSCAQIGRRVHLSAAVQIGGVLEPPGALPVIVEDDAFIGGGCGIYEGCLIREGAVLAPGVILSRATAVYDLVDDRVVRPDDRGILEIPSRAVVVPGSRPATSASSQMAGLSVYTPVIVKYRDARTDAATALEDSLRIHR